MPGPYLIVRESRIVVVGIDDTETALRYADQAFNAYRINDHPQVEDLRPQIRDMVVENLPMYLNLGSFGTLDTVIGHASASRDPQTGTSRIEITLGPSQTQLLDHLVEIADLKAVGFAGIMRKGDKDGR